MCDLPHGSLQQIASTFAFVLTEQEIGLAGLGGVSEGEYPTCDPSESSHNHEPQRGIQAHVSVGHMQTPKGPSRATNLGERIIQCAKMLQIKHSVQMCDDTSMATSTCHHMPFMFGPS